MKDKVNYLYTNQFRVHELLTSLTVVLLIFDSCFLGSARISRVGVDPLIVDNTNNIASE